LAFYQKKASSMEQADLKHMFKQTSRSVTTSTTVVSPDPLLSTPSTLPTMKTLENIQEDHDDPPQADGDIQMEYTND
jgi:hypothetical protein